MDFTDNLCYILYVAQPRMEKYPSWLKGLPWKGSRSLVAARGFKSLLLRRQKKRSCIAGSPFLSNKMISSRAPERRVAGALRWRRAEGEAGILRAWHAGALSERKSTGRNASLAARQGSNLSFHCSIKTRSGSIVTARCRLRIFSHSSLLISIIAKGTELPARLRSTT